MLFQFDSLQEAFTYLGTELGKAKSLWQIRDMNVASRIEACQTFDLFVKLKTLAGDNGIQASDLEVISWLDSTNMMYSVLKLLKKNRYVFHTACLFSEYTIPFSKKRIDYLLCCQDKILIIEFSFEKWEEEAFQHYQKLRQALEYKELLGNILDEDMQIATFTFLIKPEFSQDKKPIFHTNKDTLQQLASFIGHYFDPNEAKNAVLTVYNKQNKRTE